jgi:hypothetical protein
MSNEFVLDPSVLNEIFSFCPFKNLGADEQQKNFDETATFLSAKLKDSTDGTQSIVEITMKIAQTSTNGNGGITFRTDVWLNKAICAGTVRAKDVDERDWNGTKNALRTLSNLTSALGIKGSKNPIVDLTRDGVPQGDVKVTINAYRGQSGEKAGQWKWNFRRIGKVS